MNSPDLLVPVLVERFHDGKLKRKGLLIAVDGWLAFDGKLEPWTQKPPRDGRPGMWRGKVDGVEIWLKEGVSPEQIENGLVGHLEVKLNEVTQEKGHRGGGEEVSLYLYVNVLPLPAGSESRTKVSIVRPPRVNGRRVLPPGFDPKTDFSVDRQGQPWQVITIRRPFPPTA